MAGEYGYVANPIIYSAPGAGGPGTTPAGYNPGYFGSGSTRYTSSSPQSYNSSAPPPGMAWSAAGPVPLGSGQGGGAGIQAYNPAISGPPAPFQAPQFTNSMSNWYSQGNAGGGGNISAMTPASGGGFVYPGGGSSGGASAFDQYSMMNSGQRGGTSGPTVAGGWPQSVSNPQAALASGIYGQESTYGTNPQAMSMRPNQYAAVGPMQITPIGARQYAPGQNIYDPAGNMAAGNQMVGGLLSQFGGNPYLAAAAYNWSPPKVAAGLPIPQSVQNYANNAVNAAGQWGQNQAFGNLTNQALQNAGVYGTTLNSSGGRYH